MPKNIFSKKNKQKKRFTINQKGQAFEAYRLLIAMVIALAVLVIILSAVAYFDDLRKRVSQDTMYTSFKSAVDSPNGKIVQASDLAFTSGTTFSRRQFSLKAGVEEDCILLDAENDFGFRLNDDNPDAPFVSVPATIQGSVFFQCQTENFILSPNDACYVYCLISFGKRIASED